MKTEILLDMDAAVVEAAQALAVRRGTSLSQLLGEALKNLVEPKPDYDAAKAEATESPGTGLYLGIRRG